MTEPQADAEGVRLDLVVPIYLDTQALLDLLASLEDGFGMVERISSRSNSANANETAAGGEFGVANVLNLLRIGASGSKRRHSSSDHTTERSQERYHTYGSLLHKLRSALDDEGILRRVPQDAAPGDFIEVSGVFRPNPLAASLRTIDRLVGLFSTIVGATASPSGSKGKGGGRGGQAAAQGPNRREITQMQSMIEGILNDLERGDIRTLVIDLAGGDDYKAVTSLFVEYLRDQTMTEVAYREYRLLGKVVGHVRGRDEAIDLLRGTGIAGAGDEALGMFEGAFADAAANGLNLPGMERRVSGPALEILPIGVYV